MENMVLVGEEILANLPRGLAAGEDLAAGNLLPGPFLKHEMLEALSRAMPRAMLACD